MAARASLVRMAESQPYHEPPMGAEASVRGEGVGRGGDAK